MWCGQLWAHFGHFLCESMARIWGLAEAGRLDGLIFIAKRPGRIERLKGWQKEFLDLLGIDLPVIVVSAPTEVAELVVPGQGFGLGRIDRATPEFRAFFHDRFCRDVAAEGPKKLYLSRSALGGLEGSVILEERLEARLSAAGYEIFHPQKHTVAEQVAHYRAATHVLGLDGSAFHMFGFVARADQKAAVILRRNSTVPNGLVHQIEAFSGRRPDVIAHVVADWVPRHKGRAGRYSFGQLDMAAVAAELQELGYIDNAADWTVPRFREVKSAIEGFGAAKDLQFMRKLRKPGMPAVEGLQTDAA
nr:glycosyltransferase 61 family protein [Frigidibacter sp. ROC022]